MKAAAQHVLCRSRNKLLLPKLWTLLEGRKNLRGQIVPFYFPMENLIFVLFTLVIAIRTISKIGHPITPKKRKEVALTKAVPFIQSVLGMIVLLKRETLPVEIKLKNIRLF